jgi:kynurenine formamidase
MTENPRWKRRPPGSTWGDWGPDDQLGRLNLLTADKVLKGVAEVKEGRAFCLSMPLDYPGGTVVNPRRHPPRLLANKRQGMPYIAYPLSREDPRLIDVICDDIVEMTLQYSTQWDSLAHVGQLFDADGDGKPEIVFYNGYRGGEHIIGPMDYRDGGAVERGEHVGAKALGIENMAAHPVQGRGVMIDLEHHFGRGEKFVSYDELMRIMDRDKVEVEEGDLVCFRTGYDRVILGMNKNPDPKVLESNPCAALDGRDERILNWITKTGVVALISDNRAVEASPSRPCEGEDHCASLPLHAHCLFKLGVYLGEIWLLSDLAHWLRANGRTRFLLTAPPLRLPGAVGSPANAIATV